MSHRNPRVTQNSIRTLASKQNITFALTNTVILRFIPRTTPDYTHKMAGLSKHMAPSMQRGLSRTTNPTSPPKVSVLAQCTQFGKLNMNVTILI